MTGIFKRKTADADHALDSFRYAAKAMKLPPLAGNQDAYLRGWRDADDMKLRIIFGFMVAVIAFFAFGMMLGGYQGAKRGRAAVIREVQETVGAYPTPCIKFTTGDREICP